MPEGSGQPAAGGGAGNGGAGGAGGGQGNPPNNGGDGGARAPQNPVNDYVTLVISLTVLFVTMGLLIFTFVAAPETDPAFSRKKDVLQFAISLLGPIIGYYFGRVPAERRADSAEKNTEKAQDAANAAGKKAIDAAGAAAAANEEKDQVKKAAKAVATRALTLMSAPTAQRATLGADNPAGNATNLDSARMELQNLVDSL